MKKVPMKVFFLFGGGKGAPPSPLLTGLISVWKLNEASGDRVDSVGGITLSEGSANPVTNVAGVNGQNAAWFSNPGTGSFLKRIGDASALAASGSFSIAFIASHDTTNTFRLVSKNGSLAPNQEYEIYRDNSSGNYTFKIYHNGGATNDLIDDGLTATCDFAAQLYLVVAWFNAATGDMGIRVNGLENHKTTTVVPIATSASFDLGTYNNDQPSVSQFTMQHVYFWNRALTATERATLYNDGKFSLYPFAETIQSNRLLVFDGDSLTLTRVYSHQLMGKLGRIQPYFNVSVSGQNSDQILAREAATLALYNPAYAKNILCVIMGTNDFAQSQAVADVHANLATYCAAARVVGFKVIVGTIPNSTNVSYPADFDTWRQAYNALIRLNYTTYADGLADIGGDATIGQTLSPDNGTYFYFDKIHPVSKGYEIFASLFKAAIDALP